MRSRPTSVQRFSNYLIALSALTILSGCNPPAQPSVEAQAEPAQAAEPSPYFELSVLHARSSMLGARRAAFEMAINTVEASVQREQRENPQVRPVMENPTVLSLLVSANNHGEREDCGCKANPLGGLTRRHTLVDLARLGAVDESMRWWGKSVPERSIVFTADAGDLLYAPRGFENAAAPRQELLFDQARAIVDALNVGPPDAFNVGEHDLALGLEKLQVLQKVAKFPFISANLQKEGKPLFASHVVVERGGARVAFIGVARDEEATKTYYEARGLAVRPALEAVREAAALLPEEVSAVVLLSNLGVEKTRELVGALQSEGIALTAVVVSNTASTTISPLWAAGVPILEPASRGKHLGRLDLYLQDATKGAGAVRFANAVSDPLVELRDYRRAVTGFYRASEAMDKMLIELEAMRVEIAQKQAALVELEAADENRAASESALASLQARHATSASRLELYERRLAMTADTYVRTAGTLSALSATPGAPAGSDWVEGQVIAVKLAIPEHAGVRKVLDRGKPRSQK
ncbi:MAG: hypothetical protein H0U74_12440 [Bradymonadaceae bacterium]|nr:hypothetical protein [Lujinxingiaceae bacterium]